MKVKSIILIIILFLTVSGGAASAADHAKRVEKFLIAVQKKDFKTIFDASYEHQRILSNIKNNNPKILWDKLITEYYEAERKKFERQGVYETGFLLPSCKWKVIESKKEGDKFIVYVSLNYKSVEESPLIGSKVLKEAILGFTLDAKTGLYMESSKVEKGDVHWDKVPLKIIEVRWRANSLIGLRLIIEGIGGTPPYYSTTRCGSWVIEKLEGAKVESYEDSISISLSAVFPDESFPLQCTTEIIDKSGQTDTAGFEVPKMLTPLGINNAFCWILRWSAGDSSCTIPIRYLRTGKEIQTGVSSQ